MAPIITLTTDFGLQDTYVGVMKGVLLARCPAARLVDITHLIPPQDVRAGAAALGELAPWFPAGTTHLAVVDPGVGTARGALLIQAHGQRWVGPDNGLFDEVLRGDPHARRWEISQSAAALPARSATFHGRDLFAPVAARAAAGDDPDALGQPLGPWAPPPPRWRREGDRLLGRVARADHFGNLITDIPASALGGRRDLLIHLSSSSLTTLRGLLWTYADAPDTKTPVALIGSSGYLEIAINQGSARRVLHVEPGETVCVEPGPGGEPPAPDGL